MSILEKIDKLDHAIAWRGDIPITSRYTVGIAGEKFFREIKDHARFLGTRCEECGLTYVPPTMFCERCFARLDDWVEVASTGTVFTYTVLHLDLEEKPLDEPDILAYVKLDGSDGGLIHRRGFGGALVRRCGACRAHSNVHRRWHAGQQDCDYDETIEGFCGYTETAVHICSPFWLWFLIRSVTPKQNGQWEGRKGSFPLAYYDSLVVPGDRKGHLGFGASLSLSVHRGRCIVRWTGA